MFFNWFRRRDRVDVEDGDTVSRSDASGEKQEFRLLGFDAPNINRAKSENEYDQGQPAADRLTELLANAKSVRFRITTNAVGNVMDQFGRRFARLYIDGEDVKDIAIREGWGKPYDGVGPKPDWSD